MTPVLSQILDTLWRFFGSARLASVLLLVLALAVVLGILLPQMPGQMDAAERARWLAVVQDRYPLWAWFLEKAGLFDIHDSPWFRLLLATLVFSLLIGLVERLEPIWHSFRQPNIQQEDHFFTDAARQTSLAVVSSIEQIEQEVETLSTLLKRHLYRVWVERGGDRVYLYAERFRFREWSLFLVHGGLVLIVVGVVLGTRFGRWEEEIILSPGLAYDIGQGVGFQLRLDTLQADSAPQQMAATVTVLRAGKEVKRATIDDTHPLVVEGISFHSLSHGPLLRVKGIDAQGEPILLQPFVKDMEAQEEISLLFFAAQDERYFSAPALNIIVQVTFYHSLSERGFSSAGFLIRAYHSEETELLIDKFIPIPFQQGASIQVEDMKYQIDMDHYAVLRAVRDPASGLVMVGALIGLGGLILSLCFSPSRLWATIAVGKKNEAEIRLAAAADDFPERRWAALAEEIRERLSDKR